jgi:transposase-like protein
LLRARQLAVRGGKTLSDLARQHDVQPNQIIDWKNQLLGRRSVCSALNTTIRD